MYRNQHRATKLRALSDVLEYGGVARNQEAATATLGALMQHARTLQTLQDALTRTLPIRPGLPEDKKSEPFQRAPLSVEVATTLSALENEISDAGLKAALARLRQSAQ